MSKTKFISIILTMVMFLESVLPTSYSVAMEIQDEFLANDEVMAEEENSVEEVNEVPEENIEGEEDIVGDLEVSSFDAVDDAVTNWVLVSTSEELYNIRNNLAGNYKLANDIDLSSIAEWEPIGNSSTKFTGKFTGDGYTISGLTITLVDINRGLFGYSTGSIRNVNLANVNVTGGKNVGALVGSSEGTVEKIGILSGSVTGNENVGGVVGNFAKGTANLCYSNADVTGTKTVGGLFGITSAGTVGKSYSTGNVVAVEDNAGGLIGYNKATVTNAFATGNVIGRKYVGGLVGNANAGTFTTVYSRGSVASNNGSIEVGGLIGYGSRTVTNSYWAADSANKSTSYGGERKGIANLSHKANYVSWDFNDIWKVEENATTAYLKELPKPENVKSDNLEGIVYFDGGDGTERYPYLISTPEQLDAVRNGLTSYYELENDIDLSGYDNWSPIGESATVKFICGFNGNGYTISGLTVDRESEDYVGLFGYSIGTIENVKIDSASVKGKNNVGALVGYSTGSVQNVEITNSSVVGTKNIGGILGSSEGAITNLTVLSGEVSGTENVGGMVGNLVKGSCSLSYSTINVSGTKMVGGLIGYATAGTVDSCYCTGSVTAVEDNSGGLIGYNKVKVTNSFATGSVIGRKYVGGLVGNANAGSLTNVYSLGAVSSNNGSTEVGGLSGYGSVTVTNSYWAADTSGILTSYGGNRSSKENMVQKNCYTNWDFNDIWQIEQGSTTPYLRELSKPESVKVVEISETVYFDGGDGTERFPYLISTPAQLDAVRNKLTAYYKLTNDIDLSSYENWLPIGENATYKFTGGFDGAGFTISNLTIDRETSDYVGLFGYSTGNIGNVNLENVSVIGKNSVGALVGYTTGDIYNIEMNNGNVQGTNNIGGLVGYTLGAVENVEVSNFDVVGTKNIGAAIGASEENITKVSILSGSSDGTENVGGLVGNVVKGNVSLCYSKMNVSGTRIVGGLVGLNQGTIEKCYTTGKVDGIEADVGGLVGRNYGGATINNSYSTGIVTGGNNVGGLVGYAQRKSGTTPFTNAPGIKLNYTYALGEVRGNENTTSNTSIGGLVGFIETSSYSINYSYYSMNALTEANNDNGIRRKTIYLLRRDNYENWNFDEIWQIENHNSTPYLKELPKPDSVNENEIGGIIYFEGGDGTEKNPYLISTPEQLENVRYNCFSYYKLLNDIDLNDYENWAPIGENTTYKFIGDFDGAGYTIKNLTIDRETEDYIGLFGYSLGIIKNLKISNANITGKDYVGTAVGYTTTNVEKVDVSNGIVTGANQVGGIIGWVESASAIISNCNADAMVTGISYVGGAVGRLSNGKGVLCSATGNVIGSSDYVGGLVGAATTIERSYAIGTVNGKNNVGGLAGYLENTERCYATGNVEGVEDNIGGLVGYQNPASLIANSYATGNVIGRHNVGGLVGYAPSNGQSGGSSSYRAGDIKWCYAIGNVSGNANTTKTNTLGGIVGVAAGIGGVLSGKTGYKIALYYSRELSGTSADNTIGTAVSSSDLLSADTYAGFDFDHIWQMSDTYPVFKVINLDGSGNESDPYVITTAEELNDIRNEMGYYYKLGNDIDLSGIENFVPIGDSSNKFTGSLDGDGHKITGLTINSSVNYTGLFGFITGDIKNIIIENAEITGVAGTGILAGESDGTIENCYVTGTVNGTTNTGGLVGIAKGTVMRSVSDVTVVGSTDNVSTFIGNGNAVTVNDCYSLGSVTGRKNVAGIVGSGTSAKINNTYTLANISGTSGLGAIIGANSSSTVTNSYYNSGLTGQNNCAFGTQKSIPELVHTSSYDDWDFENIWHIDEDQTLPYLNVIPDGIKKANLNYTNIWSGDGTVENPYIITNASEMDAVRNNLSAHYKLGNNIDLSSIEEWLPIGDNTNMFKGTLDGAGFTISGLTIATRGSAQYNGLFGYSAGDLTNIKIDNFNIVGGNYTGALVGYSTGNIDNIEIKDSNITGGNYTGGIAGYTTGKFEDEKIGKTNITGAKYTGGIVGYSTGEIKNILVENDVIVVGTERTGGVVGEKTNTLSAVNSNASVTGTTYVGGIAGVGAGTTELSYCSGTVTATGNYAGGLAGHLGGTIEKCYSLVNVKSDLDSAGGLIGYGNSAKINNCFSIGTVEGRKNVGSLLGYSKSATITNSYAIGKVISAETTALGLVGAKDGGTATESYWTPETVEKYASALGGRNTISAMMYETGYVNWDFWKTWKVDEGQTIAYLQELPKPTAVNKDNIAGGIFYEEGDGTRDNPYIIRTVEQLKGIAGNLYAYYELGNDIDLSGENWMPIGDNTYAFYGNIDGKNYKIKNLSIDTTVNYAGLFGYNLGTIKDINLENVNISGKDYVGAIAGYNNGKISDISVSNVDGFEGTITGNNYTAGVVGSTGTASVVEKINNSIPVSGNTDVGGVIGLNAGNVSLSYASGTVTGTGTKTGGLIGENTGTVEKCYASGAVQGGTSDTGAFIGLGKGKITDCFATGTATGTKNISAFVGNATSATITNCYGVGLVTATGANVGGLIGYNSSSTVKNSYWVPQTTNQATSKLGEERTVIQLLSESGYTDWNMWKVWVLNAGDGIAYLRELPKPDGIFLNDFDKDAPELSYVEVNNDKTTSHSFTVDISAQDTGTGIKEITLYVDYEPVKTFIYQESDLGLKQEEFTVDNLQPNRDYLYFIDAEDFAGQTTRSEIKETRTKAIGTVTLTPSTTELTTEDVTVILEANLVADQKIQYSSNGSSWKDYTDPIVVTTNKTIYARITDGKNSGERTQIVIDNIDRDAPEIIGNYVGGSYNVKFKDVGSAGLDYYQYVILDEKLADGEEAVYGEPIYFDNSQMDINGYISALINLTGGDNYLYVKAVDKAGNAFEKDFKGRFIPDTNITVEIEKVSSRSDDIKLADAEFLIEGKYNTTDENGLAEFKIVGKEEGTYQYRINETTAPDGYSPIDEAILTIKYNYYGEVINAVSNKDYVVVKDFDKQRIELKVTDDKLDAPEYKVVVKAYDSLKPEKFIEGLKYKVSAQVENNFAPFSINGKTNEDGEYVTKYLSGYGKAVIDVEPIETVKGYYLNSNITSIIFNIDEETGVIEFLPEENSDTLNYEIITDEENPENSEIIIYVEAEPKDKTNSLTVVLEENTIDGLSKVENFEFTLEQPYEMTPITEFTSSDGTLRFDDIIALPQGDYVYKIVPKENNPYGLETLRFIVTYNEFEEITDVRKISNDINQIKYRDYEENDTYYNNYDLKLTVEVDNSLRDTQKITLKNVDVEDENVGLAGIEYLITITDTLGTRNITKTTDAFGEIGINVYSDVDSIIKIKQTKNKAGYVLDDEEKVLSLKHNDVTNKVYIDFDESTENLNITEDGVNNSWVLKELSRKKIKEEKPGNIDIYLSKKAGGLEDSGLGKVKFLVEESTTGFSEEVETDKDGNCVLRNFPVSGPGTLEFTITEIETVYGYQKFEEPVKVEVIYEEKENELKTQLVLVTEGYKYVDYKKVKEYETDKLYQLDIYFDFTNKNKFEAEEENGGGLVISKTGSDSKGENRFPMGGVEFTVDIVYPDGSNINFTQKVDRNGKIKYPVLWPEGTSYVTVTETKGRAGYMPIEGSQEFRILNEDGTISIEGPEDRNISSNTSNGFANIKINNEKIPQVHSHSASDSASGEHGSGSGGEHTNITKFKIQLKNENSYNSNLTIGYSEFNVALEQDEQIVKKWKSYKSIGDNPPPGRGGMGKSGLTYTGDIKIHVEQTKAPLHHKLNNNHYEIDVNRDGEIQNIICNNVNILEGIKVEIDNKNHIIFITIYNDPAELMVGITKTDKSDPDIQLAGAGFSIGKYMDTSLGDLKTVGYIETDDTGFGSTIMNAYRTSGNTLYSIREVKIPDGYDGIGRVGLNVKTDSNGEIVSANISDSTWFTQNVAAIKKIEGNYIELEIVNARKFAPEYKIKVITKNSENEEMRVSGVTYNVKISSENGSNVNVNLGKSNPKGISVLNGLVGSGKLDIEIKQIKTAFGYKLDSSTYKTSVNRVVTQTVSTEQGNRYTQDLTLIDDVELVADAQGIASNDLIAGALSTDGTVSVEVNNVTKEIIFTILAEPDFGIYLEKVDARDNDVKLYNAEFNLQSTEGQNETITTDRYGKAFIPFEHAVLGKTVTYILTELSAPLGYENFGTIEPIVFEVEYNAGGKIVTSRILGGGEKVSEFKGKEGASAVYLTIENGERPEEIGGVGNPDEPDDGKFNFEILKTNIHNPIIKIENVVFDIRVAAESGETKQAIKVSGREGKIKLKNLEGYGIITIDLTEIESDTGYALDSETRRITLYREKVGDQDKITILEDETADDLTVYTSEEDKKVNVIVKNEIALDTLGLAIIKEDYDDSEIKLKGAEFAIKDFDTEKVYTGKTNEEGLLYKSLEIKEYPGTATYKITETKSPEGYESSTGGVGLTEVATLQVTYDENGEITLAEILENTENYEITVSEGRYIEIRVRNTLRELESYTLTILETDGNDIKIVIPETYLGITVDNQYGKPNTKHSYTETYTNEFGEIDIDNSNGYGDINISINEITPAPGRRFDDRVKSSRMNRDKITGKLTLEESLNCDTIIDNDNHHITIIVRCWEAPGQYTFVLEKENEDGTEMLQNAKFSIALPEVDEIEMTTDEEGRLVLQNMNMPREYGTYTAVLKELEAPEGYKKIEDEIKVDITIEPGTLEVGEPSGIITNAVVSENSEVATVAEFKKQYVKVTVKDELEEIPENPEEPENPDTPEEPVIPDNPEEQKEPETDINQKGDIGDEEDKKDDNKTAEEDKNSIDDITENGGKIHGNTENKNIEIKDIESITIAEENEKNESTKMTVNVKDKLLIRTGDSIIIYYIEMFIGIISLSIIGCYAYKKKKDSK